MFWPWHSRWRPHRARLTDVDVTALRAVGFDDECIVQVLALPTLNLSANYINVAFDVPVGFSRAKLNPLA